MAKNLKKLAQYCNITSIAFNYKNIRYTIISYIRVKLTPIQFYFSFIFIMIILLSIILLLNASSLAIKMSMVVLHKVVTGM